MTSGSRLGVLGKELKYRSTFPVYSLFSGSVASSSQGSLALPSTCEMALTVNTDSLRLLKQH